MKQDQDVQTATSGDHIDLVEWYFEQGWTDGLPVVPPTPETVAAMVAALGGDAGRFETRVPPRWGNLTREVLAINMVLAGCKPAHAPVVRAAMLALCSSHFNLNGIQATTHMAAPLLVVNGPARCSRPTPRPRRSTATRKRASRAWRRPSSSTGSRPRTTWWSPLLAIEGPARRAVCTTRSGWKNEAFPPRSSSPRRSPERLRCSAPPWVRTDSSLSSSPTRSAPCPRTRSRRARKKPCRRFSVSWLNDSHSPM